MKKFVLSLEPPSTCSERTPRDCSRGSGGRSVHCLPSLSRANPCASEARCGRDLGQLQSHAAKCHHSSHWSHPTHRAGSVAPLNSTVQNGPQTAGLCPSLPLTQRPPRTHLRGPTDPSKAAPVPGLQALPLSSAGLKTSQCQQSQIRCVTWLGSSSILSHDLSEVIP